MQKSKGETLSFFSNVKGDQTEEPKDDGRKEEKPLKTEIILAEQATVLYNNKTIMSESGNRQKMNNKMYIHNYNSYLLVDRAQLLKNARTIIGSLGGSTSLIPVLKDDAYGLGLVPVAQALCSLTEIRTIALAHVSEGLALRAAGIDREILVMGGALPFQMDSAVETGLTLACGHAGFATQLAVVAGEIGKRAKIQIKIDTGLHRIGFEPAELDALASELRACGEQIEITGAFSHFSDVADKALNVKEYDTFMEALDCLRAHDIPIPMCHMACSASSENWPQYNLDAVRCGRRLYMDRPEKPDGSIREVASFRSFVTQVKKRPAGEKLGYGGAVTLTRETLVATVGVGYGDGLNQELFRIHAPVLVRGQRCPMLCCCMDQCMIDVTGLECAVGDEVTFFGYDAAGNFLSSQKIAAMVNHDEGCGLTSALSTRVARVYKG